MTCARAGAQLLTPSIPAGFPHSSDAHTGGSRTRLFLLPVLALLLGALSLFHAVPAKAQAPAAPTGLTITASDANLELSWTASTGALRYNVQYTSAPASGQGSVANSAAASGNDPATGWVGQITFTTATSSNLQGLTNGTPYRVRVRANNASGSSAWVHGSGTPTIVLKWPFSSTNRREGGANDTVFVSIGFTQAINAGVTYAPGSSNPASLTDDLTSGYATTISAAASTQVDFLLAAPVDDTVNEANETFDVTINAGTGYTVGTPSTITVTIVDNDPPAAPTLRVTPGGRKLTATWDKPAGPVGYYILRYKTALAPDQPATGRDLSTGWVANPVRNATSQIIDRLTAGTEYHVQVRANDGQGGSGNGDSEWSASVTGTPTELPSIALSATPNPVDEGESVTVTATLRSAAPDGGLVVPLTLTAGTAETGDYGTLATITINQGQTTATGTITTIVDTDPDDETFTVAIDRETMLAQGFAPGPGDLYSHQIQIKDKSELMLEINYGDQKLLVGPYGELGDPTDTYKRYVQASPTMKRLTLKLSWTAGAIEGDPTAQVYYYMPGVAGDTLTWGAGQNGTTKMLEMYSHLGTPGYPKVTLSAGGGIEYTIIFQNNSAWEFHHNNLLDRLEMTIPQGQ